MNTDERPSIKLWNYVFENCGCQLIKHERAYSAFMTLAGYDYQEFALDEDSARIKLADSVFTNISVINWYKDKFNCA